MDPAYQIRTSPSKHRALHAARALTPGALIAVFPSPAARPATPAPSSSPLPSPAPATLALPPMAARTTTCSSCLATPPTPRRCTACKATAYCDAACQKSHWSSVHARECAALRAAGGEGAVPAYVRMAMQVLLWPEKFAAVEALLDGNVDRFEGRAEAWPGMEVPAKVMGGWVAAGAKGKGKAVEVTERRVVELLCKIKTNAFTRSEAGEGLFLDTTLAMVNHSCVPNAIVAFSGRRAFLRALRDIKEGEEIEISYIDCTQSLEHRRKALELYFFQCVCTRCKEDLDNYQLAARSPTSTIKLNSFSVVPAPHKYRETHGDLQGTAQAAGRERRVYGTLPSSRDFPLPERRRQLIHSYASATNGDSDRWAIEPTSYFLQEALTYYKSVDKLEAALAVASLIAVESDPYKYVEPFHVQRVQGLMGVANILLGIPPGGDALPSFARQVGKYTDFPAAKSSALSNVDFMSLCQMVLVLVVKWAPLGHSPEWELYLLYREQLQEIEALPGRDRENGMIRAWASDPSQMAQFFDFAVVKPMALLAELGKAVLAVDFAKDKNVCDF
ncbi:hypothetical protein VDGD_03295 [Verticillium dahliae]|nr:hypothetical protein VDGD_03295 [Verticillium dahliae]